MADKRFRYTLKEEIIGGGTNNLVLSHNPLGWEEKNLTFLRSKDYNSVLRSISLSLKFVLEGKDFLDRVYNEKGYFGRVQVVIEWYNTNTFTFESYYNGVINFSKYVCEEVFTEVDIVDNDYLEKLNARQDINIDIFTKKDLDGDLAHSFNLSNEMVFRGSDIINSAFINSSRSAAFVNAVA